MAANESHSTGFTYAKLHGLNYRAWSEEMEAYLKEKRCWRVTAPIANANAWQLPTINAAGTNTDEIARWQEANEQACGLIWRNIDEAQRLHVNAHRDGARAMWDALLQANAAPRATARFQALRQWISIRMEETESMEGLIARVEAASIAHKAVTPVTHTVDNLHKEISALALIYALPDSLMPWRDALL